jgi:hypothetical protein
MFKREREKKFMNFSKAFERNLIILSCFPLFRNNNTEEIRELKYIRMGKGHYQINNDSKRDFAPFSHTHTHTENICQFKNG